MIKEQCVFEALNGQKSHWFHFMATLVEGCVVRKGENEETSSNVNVARMKPITPECFEKALKFSQAYSNYDHGKFLGCYEA